MTLQIEKLVDTVLESTFLFQGMRTPHHLISCYSVDKGACVTHVNGTGIVCVLKGQVDIYTIARDGNHVLLSSSKKGDFFGVSNLFYSQDLQTRLMAKTTTQLVHIPKEVFIQMMGENPELAIRYGVLCNQKIQFLLDRIAHLTIQSAKQKLGLYLLDTSTKKQPTTLESREKLASYLGVSRASLFRELSFFKKEGIIQLSGSSLTVLDTVRLKQYCL
ncbi:MAG: Crp/Fnr family transcriptional regulator [Eubacteriales bacterium]